MSGKLTQISELSLLYWYTGDEKYAEHAALMARVFFLDPNTNMHPHLTFAQTVPGLQDFDSVIGYGIIEAIQLSEVRRNVAHADLSTKLVSRPMSFY